MANIPFGLLSVCRVRYLLMKTLHLIRHAKSGWTDSNMSDHDRPLDKRGLDDAPMMAKRLQTRGIRLDGIVTSSALRAVTTAQLFANSFGLDSASLHVDQRLYHANPDEILEVLQQLDDMWTAVMCVGHHPGMPELADLCCDDRIGHMPTCAIVTIEIDADRWQDIRLASKRLIDFDFPKNSSDV